MGALLAGHGLRCFVTFAEETPEIEADALVIDTESRHLPDDEAASRVLRALQSIRAERRFKKVDSTLRGPVEAEVRAFAGVRPVVFTPAYPAMGRTVRGGVLYVNGIEAGRTTGLPMHDASTDADLAVLVASQPGCAFAGSGGLGRAWVESLPRGTYVPPALSKPRRCLLVCGSRHEASREQAMQACAQGVPVLITPEQDADNPLAIAREAAQLEGPDLLIVFGGDTAHAVLRQLGITQVEAVRELLPGIPLSTARGMMIVTKAGGFGSPRIVDRILEQLQ